MVVWAERVEPEVSVLAEMVALAELAWVELAGLALELDFGTCSGNGTGSKNILWV